MSFQKHDTSGDAESIAFRHFLSGLNEENKYRARERVAILVFDGGATRKEAEDFVMKKAKEQLEPPKD